MLQNVIINLIHLDTSVEGLTSGGAYNRMHFSVTGGWAYNLGGGGGLEGL